MRGFLNQGPRMKSCFRFPPSGSPLRAARGGAPGGELCAAAQRGILHGRHRHAGRHHDPQAAHADLLGGRKYITLFPICL